MNVLRIELSDILRQYKVDEASARLIERRIEDAIIEASKSSELTMKEHAMENYLSHKEYHEKESNIVKAISELRVEMHQQTWKIIGLLGGLMALLKFIPNIFH